MGSLKMIEADYYDEGQELRLHQLPSMSRTSQEPLQLIVTIRSTYSSSSINKEDTNINDQVNCEVRPDQDSWLPLTESRSGSVFSAALHLLSSGIGFQALLLPLAFVSLGWTWGIICLSVAFAWQLYTIWLLVQLHEPYPGTRYSRYLQLSLAAFGGKVGKLITIFPMMYLSGGACVILIITGGGTLELFFKTICHSGGATCHHAKSLTGTEWFLVFTCMAIALAQFPNLNSIAGVSLVGALSAVGYCTMILVFSITKGRPADMSYRPSQYKKSDMARLCDVLNAIGIIVLAFRGHNLVLEIQGTLPSTPTKPSRKPMLKAVIISYLIIALCLFSVSIGGYWAYGNKTRDVNGGLLSAFSHFHHGPRTSKWVMGLIYLLVVINSLCSFQIYAMPAFDNLELRYTSMKKKRCPRWVRVGFRLFFGGVAFFVAVAFPFLGSLSALIGGITLPLAYVYPCFMWIIIKKPCLLSAMKRLNLALGCLGILLSLLLVVAAAWSLADNGLKANFFHPS